MNAAFDSTGGGGPFGDIVRMEWSPHVLGISSGGKASSTPVGTEVDSDGNKITCAQRYFNKATELWMGAMPFLRSKQIKGMYSELAKQLCKRQYDKGGGDGRTLRVEDKRKFKAREGGSPDQSDSFMLLIELAKKRHGFKPAERAAVDKTPGAKGTGTWKSFCEKARRLTRKL